MNQVAYIAGAVVIGMLPRVHSPCAESSPSQKAKIAMQSDRFGMLHSARSSNGTAPGRRYDHMLHPRDSLCHRPMLSRFVVRRFCPSMIIARLAAEADRHR